MSITQPWLMVNSNLDVGEDDGDDDGVMKMAADFCLAESTHDFLGRC